MMTETRTNKKLITLYKDLKELTNPCRDYAITSLEAEIFKVERGSVLSGVLGSYKEYILKEIRTNK
jgi:hypothetical protein